MHTNNTMRRLVVRACITANPILYLFQLPPPPLSSAPTSVKELLIVIIDSP